MKKRKYRRTLLRLVREEHGAEMVEFAVTALLLMTLIVGMIGFSMAMYTYHFVSSAAQQGMRFAIVRGQTWSKNLAADCSTSSTNFTIVYNCTASATDIQNYVKSLTTPGINPSNLTINTSSSYVWPGLTPDGATCSPANSQGCLVKVTVNYTFNYFNIFFLSTLPAMSMSATSEGVILQ